MQVQTRHHTPVIIFSSSIPTRSRLTLLISASRTYMHTALSDMGLVRTPAHSSISTGGCAATTGIMRTTCGAFGLELSAAHLNAPLAPLQRAPAPRPA